MGWSLTTRPPCQALEVKQYLLWKDTCRPQLIWECLNELAACHIVIRKMLLYCCVPLSLKPSHTSSSSASSTLTKTFMCTVYCITYTALLPQFPSAQQAVHVIVSHVVSKARSFHHVSPIKQVGCDGRQTRELVFMASNHKCFYCNARCYCLDVSDTSPLLLAHTQLIFSSILSEAIDPSKQRWHISCTCCRS